MLNYQNFSQLNAMKSIFFLLPCVSTFVSINKINIQ